MAANDSGPLRPYVALVVFAVWTGAAVRALILADTQALLIVTPLALIIVTALFTPIRRNGGG